MTAQTLLEKIATKVESKLEKLRAENSEFPPCLTAADPKDIEAIKVRWKLPAIYLEFLSRFSPRYFSFKVKQYNLICLYGASDLIEGQQGYSEYEGQSFDDWPSHLVVIASQNADPYVLDLSRSDGNDAPVLHCEHGLGEWDFEDNEVFPSFLAFFKHLSQMRLE